MYHRLPIADSLDQDLVPFFPNALEFIRQGELLKQKTLVHCNAGVSRSGAIIVAWLMSTTFNHIDDPQTRYTEALRYAKSKRPKITPNSHFATTLKSHTFPSCSNVQELK